ncbi:hypothetical protein GTP81_23470 [Rugamonas sp. FT107W]|uniref:Uncharacterized protein n=1 Tax=Duganella vulcania TaxID=2692166 RepID=A0A845HLT5_9BURK|nr:hypothetical protein [Duganella vulcania]MYN19708.1 hypothetical protein [Duganella vulcania]
MRRICLCLILSCGALSLSANAVDVLPAHLVGTWGTGASLYDGVDKQSEIYLLPDGFGMAAGSTEPARRADGVDDGKPGPRAIIGFPVRAVLEGETLSVRVLLPKNQPAMKDDNVALSCRHERTGEKLTCTGPDGVPMTMSRRSVSVSDDVVRTIEQIRALQY